MDPANHVRGPARARRELQPEARQRCDLSDGQHRARRAAWTRGPRPPLTAAGRRISVVWARRHEREFTTPCRSRVRSRSPVGLLRSARCAGENRPVSLREHTVDDVLEARARYVARGVSTPKLVVTRAVGAQVEAADGTALPRLRRRDRLPEHRPRLRAGRRRDPRAGRPLPAPVLHGRHLRAVRRGLPPARRALSVQGFRAEVDPRQLGRRGDRERGQDRARRHRPPRRCRFRQRLPRPHAPDDGDDEQGAAVQGRLRALPGRDLPGRGAVSLPRHRHGRRDRLARAPVQERRRRGVGRLRRARDGPGRRRLHR